MKLIQADSPRNVHLDTLDSAGGTLSETAGNLQIVLDDFRAAVARARQTETDSEAWQILRHTPLAQGILVMPDSVLGILKMALFKMPPDTRAAVETLIRYRPAFRE